MFDFFKYCYQKLYIFVSVVNRMMLYRLGCYFGVFWMEVFCNFGQFCILLIWWDYVDVGFVLFCLILLCYLKEKYFIG